VGRQNIGKETIKLWTSAGQFSVRHEKSIEGPERKEGEREERPRLQFIRRNPTLASKGGFQS